MDNVKICFKRIMIFVIIVALNALAGVAQSTSRQRNTIYVLDCTGSMSGYNGAPDIWQPTKQFLKAELEKEAKENPNSRVVILPFQDKVHHPIHVNLKNIGWPKLESVLDGYVKQLTGTNICDSWLEAERYIDQSCDNYIVLMTDGQDNSNGNGNQRLAAILKAFCGKYKNTKGFYVELTQAASLPAGIKNVIDVCDDLTVIDASAGIPSFGCYSSDVIEINTRDLPTDITLGFSNSGTFAANLLNDANKFVTFSIKGNSISQGKITIHVESKFGDNIEALNRAIGQPSIELPIVVQSDDVIITNPEIDVVLNTKPMRQLNLKVDDAKKSYSSAEHIKPFLWVKGNDNDTLRWNLASEFNEQAKTDNSSAMFRIKSDRKLSEYELLYDGAAIPDNIIEIRPEEKSILEVIIPAQDKDDKVSLDLIEIHSNNLDRINGERPEGFKINLEGDYQAKTSLTEIIFWIIIGLIALFLLSWFGFIRNMKYPKFKRGKITIQNPYFANMKVQGYRKVVMGPRKKEQGAFDKIWRGKILYHSNPEWSSEVEITPSGKNMRFRCPTGELISDPAPLWTAGCNYKVLSANNPSKKIEIIIN